MKRAALMALFATSSLAVAFAAHSALLGALLLLLSLVAPWIGGRIDVDRATQRVLSLVLGLVAIALFRASNDPFPDSLLSLFWVGTATAAIGVAAFRVLCKEPEGGLRGTVVVLAIALLASGAGRVGRGYTGFVVTFLLAATWAFRASDPSRASGPLSPRARAASALVFVAALAFGFVVTAPLRPAAVWLQRRAIAAYDDAYAHRGGLFTDRMRVGRLDPMLRSDAVALRLRGPHVELLRAEVFDRYDGGEFVHSHDGSAARLRVAERLDGRDVDEVTRTRAAGDRAPLPLGAVDVASTSELERELFGVVRAPLDASRYAFRAPKGDPVMSWPPGPNDLELPDELRPYLERLAREWTETSRDPDEIVRRIERHLRSEFHYELGRDHLRGRDPILHFLMREPYGHCEYFAGAAVLLARAAGVPARMVVGYRVVEKNPIDGHYVVREKNAHAWMEAWTSSRGWIVVDATPMTESMHDEEIGAASEDAAVATLERIEGWLADRSIGELVTAALVGAVLFIVVRVRNARKAALRAIDDPLGDASLPTVEATALFLALARRGAVRGRAEPIERFAARLDDDVAADLLRRYAARRYGGGAEHDDTGLSNALRAHAARVSAS